MRCVFFFLGEEHHVFHALPLAGELAEIAPDADIEIVYTDAGQQRMGEKIAPIYPALARVKETLLRFPLFDALRNQGVVASRLRLLRLLRALPLLRRADAVIAPERTTTIIRHLLPRRTRLIFTPHGAGDRAIMLDPRDRHFDFVLVAGEKSEARLLEAGTIRPGHYTVNGYIKADLMGRMGRIGRAAAGSDTQTLFANDRPTVLYNPHFRASLSSWPRFGRELIAAFAAQDRFNLVVAPHYRLFSDADEAAKQAVEALAVPGRIIVDLRSDRLFDMSYTLGADIYIGDVSSQVYEFLTLPRPCLFLNAHGTNWRGDPDYRFWTLGDVAGSVAELMGALDVARERHPLYRALQEQAVRESVGGDPTGAAERGARAIWRYINGKD